MSSCSAPACPVSVVGSCGSSSWLAHQLWGGCCAPRLPPAGALQTPWLQLLVHTRVLLLDAFCGASSALLLCASLFPRPSDLPARSARPFGALPSLTACAARWCRAQRSEVDVSYFRAAGAVIWLEAGLRAAHGSPRGPVGVMLSFMGSVPPPRVELKLCASVALLRCSFWGWTWCKQVVGSSPSREGRPTEDRQALLQLHGSKTSVSGGERKLQLFSSCLAPCFCLPCFVPARMKKQGSGVQNGARSVGQRGVTCGGMGNWVRRSSSAVNSAVPILCIGEGGNEPWFPSPSVGRGEGSVGC